MQLVSTFLLDSEDINSLIIYRDLPANKESTLEHIDFHLAIVCDLLQAGSLSTMKSSSRIPASQNITQPALATQCYDMEVGENRVRIFYSTEKREKEKDSRYIQEASAPAAVTVYQICNMSPAHVHQ